MKIFRRIKDRTVSHRLAQRIAEKITLGQRRLADQLNDRTQKFSARAWLFALIWFCLLTGGYFLYLLIMAFN